MKTTISEGVKTFMIDLFAGAGGTTASVHEAGTNVEVVACINHDPIALRSHHLNFPNCLHYTEDIRTIAMSPLVKLIEGLRKLYPGCKIAIWASLECTHHSKAKGGQSRDADSRSLAEHLYRYIKAIDPDFLWIENVREFMDWGPLRLKEGKNSNDQYSELAIDKKGEYIKVPIKEEKGLLFNRWKEMIESFGYHYEHRLLNSADFEGYTTRIRYFAQFAKDPEVISWPEPMCTKEEYKPVKDVLDLDDEGTSIFIPGRIRSDKTFERIYAGLVKFVAKGDNTFIKKYFSGRPKGKVISIDGPAGTVTTIPQQAIVKCNFLYSYYGNSTLIGSDEPCGTITTKDRFAKVEPQFFNHYYTGGGQLSSIWNPHPCVLAIPKSALTTIKFIDNQYGNSKPKTIYYPVGTVTVNPKQALVSVQPWLLNKNSSTAPSKSVNRPAPTITQRTHYLMNPQWGGMHRSLDRPCFTLIARMDKAPPYLIGVDNGNFGIPILKTDSEIVMKIKIFMALYNITDIKMRMLKIPELLAIQGFPKGYKLTGNKTQQKKFIGNSVEVNVGKALFKAIDHGIQTFYSNAV